MLANFTAQAQQVELAGLGGTVTVRRLDATNVLQAMQEPVIYRTSLDMLSADGSTIDLPPFALICLDR
ncbi:MAG: hypothetical protein R2932_28285 [Caldilineaceae bacterium]